MTITARLRDSEPVAQGKEPFRQDGAQQVYSINTAQISDAHRRPAGRVVSAAGRGSARRPRRDRPAPPGCRARSCPTASSGSRSASSPRSGWATSCTPRSGQRRRERAAAAAARTPTRRSRPRQKLADRYGRAALTRHDQRPRRGLHDPRQPHRPREIGDLRALARRRASAGSPVRVRTASARRAARRAHRRTPPRPRPRWGWGAGRRRAATRAARPTGDPPTTGAQTATSSAGDAGGDEVGGVVETRCGPTESDVARRAVADHRVQRVGAAVHQHARARRRPRPTTAGATCASEVFSATDSSAARVSPPRRARPGRVRTATAAAAARPSTSPAASRLGHLLAGARSATCRPARRTSPPRWPRPSTPVRAARRSAPRRHPSTPSAPSSAPVCSAPAPRASA